MVDPVQDDTTAAFDGNPRNIPMKWGDLTLNVEYMPGDLREFPGTDYPPMLMHDIYGYIEGTPSMEVGDEMDFFMAELPRSSQVVVIAMAEDGGYQEDKVFFGYTLLGAQAAFDRHYEPAKRLFSYAMTTPDFEKMLALRVAEGERNAKTVLPQDQVHVTPDSMTDTRELEEQPTVLFKTGVAGASREAQLLWKSLREMREVPKNPDAPLFATYDHSRQALDPASAARAVTYYGASGPGHAEGQIFSPRRANFAEFALLSLLAAGVTPVDLHKMVLRFEGDDQEQQLALLKGWHIIPR